MPEKCDYIKFRNFERKIKSPFMFYADFEIILEPQNNAKQNTDVPYIQTSNKNMLLAVMTLNQCVNDKISKPFYKSYLRKDAVYNFTKYDWSKY